MSRSTSINPKRRRVEPKPGSWRAFMALVADARKPLDRETMRMNNQFVNGVRAVIVSQIASLIALVNIVFAVLATALIMASVVFVYVLAAGMFPLYKWRIVKQRLRAEAAPPAPVPAQDVGNAGG